LPGTYARAVAAAMEADEIDSLAARLEARADITDDVIHQKTDLAIEAYETFAEMS
jgi:hypothetical protein